MSSRTALRILVAGAFMGGLAACGSSPVDRGVTGAALGAATGVAAAALTKNDLGPAALVGGLVGAGVGAATTSQDFDLGEPVYRRSY